VGFVLLPEFSMIAFSAALEPLRTANRISGKTLYEWLLIAPEGNSVHASNGIEISTAFNIDTAPALPMVLLVGGAGNEHYHNPRLSAWLRRVALTSTTLGAISAAPYALARAGLLHNRRCTLHWERTGHFADEFPDCVVTQDIFVSDGRILTCAGGTSSFDMMVWVIAGQLGGALARAVSDTCIYPAIRDGGAKQRMGTERRLGTTNRYVVALVDEMERNIERPLNVAELARVVGLSARQVGRLFREHLGDGPHQYYLKLRLDRASILLSQSDHSILEIALACGFSSSSHFSQSFVTHFGLTPREARLRDRGKTFGSIAEPKSRLVIPLGRSADRGSVVRGS
jgi:transcriptional regulator GlxA family with amidase domain